MYIQGEPKVGGQYLEEVYVTVILMRWFIITMIFAIYPDGFLLLGCAEGLS